MLGGSSPTERERRSAVGLVSHRGGLYDELSVRENLRFFGRLYGVAALERRIAEVIGELGLTHVANQSVKTLSRGMQQRAALARGVLHGPQVLLLDEPETGLDVQGQEALNALLDRWGSAGYAAVVATHRLDWAAHVATRAIVLQRGAVEREIAAADTSFADAYSQAIGAVSA